MNGAYDCKHDAAVQSMNSGAHTPGFSGGLFAQPVGDAANDAAASHNDCPTVDESSNIDERDGTDGASSNQKRTPGIRRRLTGDQVKQGEIAAANARLREQIGRRIAEGRRVRNWNQAEAAHMFGCANSTQLNLWERAIRPVPLDQLQNIARVLECSLDWLFGGDEPDLDRVGAARARISETVQRTLEKTAEIVTGEIERHARLLGPGLSDVREVLIAGEALLDAVQTFMRRNQKLFEHQIGGATIVRTGQEFEVALADARRKTALKNALDGDIRRALEALKP